MSNFFGFRPLSQTLRLIRANALTRSPPRARCQAFSSNASVDAMKDTLQKYPVRNFLWVALGSAITYIYQKDFGKNKAALTSDYFTSVLGKEGISFDAEDIEQHANDKWSYHKGEGRPALILYPHTTEHVSKILRFCHDHFLPVVPYGSGTSLEGHIVPSDGDYKTVYLDFSAMQAVRRIDVKDRDCVVQPGLTWEELNKQLRPLGLFFPVDPGPGASIGGMIGTDGSICHEKG